MRGFLKKISAAGLSILMLSACSANENETITTTLTSESIVITETEIKTISSDAVSETAVMTSAEAMTEISAESYEPDRSFEFTNECFSKSEDYINRPMFLGAPENTGTEVYVMLSDEIWEYYDPFWNETKQTISQVLLKHDGVTDIISTEWVERFREPFKLYSGDYDADGENEIAAVRYDSGGTICSVSYLTIFDKTDGHYKSYIFDQYGFINENITADIDKNSNEITFRVNGCEDFVYDTSELFESEVSDVSLGNLIGYTVDSDNILVTYGFCIHSADSSLPELLNLNLNIQFKSGEFILSDAEYTEME